MPFDAMKGLQEALRAREEQHARVEKRELSEEAARRLDAALRCVTVGQTVRVRYYRDSHEYEKCGRVTARDDVLRLLTLDEEKIPYDNLYAVAPQTQNENRT